MDGCVGGLTKARNVYIRQVWCEAGNEVQGMIKKRVKVWSTLLDKGKG